MLCSQSADLELSLRRRVFIFVVGILESMLFTGTVFGWPQLVHVLKVEGLYSDLCDGTSSSSFSSSSSYSSTYTQQSSQESESPRNLSSALNLTAVLSLQSPPLNIFNNSRCFALNNTYDISHSHKIGVEQCAPQDERFALIFTITVGCYSLTGILVGYLLHHVGLRFTRLSGGTMITLSFLFLSITTKESPGWLFPTMVFMALGGNQLRMAVLQMCDLFPENRATALTLLSGTYAASAALFLIFQYTATAGISRVYVCWVFIVISILLSLTSFMMPVHHIPVKNISGKDEAHPQSSSQTLSKSLFSCSSILHQYFFFMCLFAVNVYQQTFNVWINLSSCSVEEASVFSMLYSYSNLVTVFFGPLGGVFTDYMVRRAQNTPNKFSRRVKEIQAPFWPLLVTTAATVIMYACKFFLHPAAVYFSLVCMIIARPCVVAVSTAFVRIRFPVSHFNRLIGIYGTVTAVLMFLQYPHFLWAQNMYYTAHGIVVVLTLLSVTYPLHLLFTPFIHHGVTDRDSDKEDNILNNDASPQDSGARA